MTSETNNRRSLRAVEGLNFFLADVQTGLGPFLAAYLASSGWDPARVGFALTFGGLATVALQTPAGAVVDAMHRKRLLIGVSLGVLACGAVLLLLPVSNLSVYSAQLLIGGSAPFLAPAVAAMTLGIVGARAFDKQFGRNQAFNSAGNVFTALLIAYASFRFGYRSIFLIAIAMVLPSLLALLAIDPQQIDYARARGSAADGKEQKAEGLASLLRDRGLVLFLVCAFLFHLANAAMLPQLGEMLSKNNPKAAAPFMSACIIVTQAVITVTANWIGKRAATHGRKTLLLVGFGILPVRGVLYTLSGAAPYLIGVQVLDGVANAIFVIVSILVIKDRTEGTGRFNVAAGALATMVGIGAALSNTVGGVLIQRLGYHSSFLGLAAIALAAFLLLWSNLPETLNSANPGSRQSSSSSA
jgi:MFS family permease